MKLMFQFCMINDTLGDISFQKLYILKRYEYMNEILLYYPTGLFTKFSE